VRKTLLSESLLTNPKITFSVVVIIWVVLFTTSGLVVKIGLNLANIERSDDLSVDTGTFIGKVENILILFLVLVGAYTALSVVVAGKSVVRQADMDGNDSSYYLVGTLVNFLYSVVLSLAARLALQVHL
jgi:hypothetical protein